MNPVLLVVNHFDTTTVYNLLVDAETLHKLRNPDPKWFAAYEATIHQSCILHSTSLGIKSTGVTLQKSSLIVVDL